MQSSIELAALIIEMDENISEIRQQLHLLGESGPIFLESGESAFVCRNMEDRMVMRCSLDSAKDYRDRLVSDWLQMMDAELESVRRNCTPDEVIALWEDRCTYTADYDDHSSDDCRCEQNILNEVGMHIEVNPIGLNKLDRNAIW